jgi:hypothetical protein
MMNAMAVNEIDPVTDAIHYRNRVRRMYSDWKRGIRSNEFLKLVYKDDEESKKIFKEIAEENNARTFKKDDRGE